MHKIQMLMMLCCTVSACWAGTAKTLLDTDNQEVTLKAGDPSLKKWILPETPDAPDDNKPSNDRIMLGKKLFFDPRISKEGNLSCASCHNPSFAWADPVSKPIAVGHQIMPRNTQSIVNSAYNMALLWDGRKDTLDEQAVGPLISPDIMGADINVVIKFLKSVPSYKRDFEKAYPNQEITKPIISKALAAFERSVVVRDTAFDKWLQGDAKAMSPQAVRGFSLFIDPKKASCASCHSAPNFTDNGFHNIGLVSYSDKEADMGRFKQKKVNVLKGAFKTPSLREIAKTAPYFHDGSAPDLITVVNHYDKGGEVKDNISKMIKPLHLDSQEKEDLVAFMKALTAPHKVITVPDLTEE